MSEDQTQNIADKCDNAIGIARKPEPWYVQFNRSAQHAAAYATPFIEQKATSNPRNYLNCQPRNSA